MTKFKLQFILRTSAAHMASSGLAQSHPCLVWLLLCATGLVWFPPLLPPERLCKVKFLICPALSLNIRREVHEGMKG